MYLPAPCKHPDAVAVRDLMITHATGFCSKADLLSCDERLHKNSDMLLSRDGLAHRCEYLLIRWESHPPLFRYHMIAYPDAELAAVAFDQFRLYS